MTPSEVELARTIQASVCSVHQAAGFSDLIKTATSLIALPFAGFTFWLGYRQRERERTRSYYHKVVVDVVLPDILTFFDQQGIELRAAGHAALTGAASPRRAIPKSCKAALAVFGTSLFDLQDKIVQRTAIFDENLTLKLEDTFPKIQDDVTNWFSAVDLQKSPSVEGLTAVLRSSQRAVIRLLYTGEYKNF